MVDIALRQHSVSITIDTMPLATAWCTYWWEDGFADWLIGLYGLCLSAHASHLLWSHLCNRSDTWVTCSNLCRATDRSMRISVSLCIWKSLRLNGLPWRGSKRTSNVLVTRKDSHGDVVGIVTRLPTVRPKSRNSIAGRDKRGVSSEVSRPVAAHPASYSGAVI